MPPAAKGPAAPWIPFFRPRFHAAGKSLGGLLLAPSWSRIKGPRFHAAGRFYQAAKSSLF